MSVLSGKAIRERIAKGELVIKGIGEPSVGAASVDIHLSDRFTAFKYSAFTAIDSKNWDNPARYEKVLPDGRITIWHDYTDEYVGPDPFSIHPGDCVLGVSKEYLKIPQDLIGRFYPKSGLTKMGLAFESAASWAGVLTPGFEGDFQFSMVNNGWMPIKIYPDMIVGEVFFEKIEQE
ncbi:hypothetical protein HY546_02180 [archaeon]|nr:hypothetical protein [archaeon]